MGQITCSKCGFIIPEGNQFCPNCGKIVSLSSGIINNNSEVKVEPREPLTKKQKKILLFSLVSIIGLSVATPFAVHLINGAVEFNSMIEIKEGVLVDFNQNIAEKYGITEIKIPDSVTTIGEGAFYDCDSLTSIIIPDSVTTIGDGAFNDCDSLTSIIIPDSVTTIGYSAFSGCSSLTSIEIADSVTTIGGYAFNNCYSLTIYCEAPSEPSGWDIDWNCSNRLVYWGVNTDTLITGVEQNGIQYSIINGEAVVIKYVGTDTSVVIPSTIEVEGVSYDVTTISESAFYSCSYLTSVTIGNSVTTIGEGAFFDCDSLTSIIIPDSVTTIGSSAFSGCSSLTSIVIPDSVTTIGSSAFYECYSLTSIIIPDNVTSIGSYAFYNCSFLTSIVIPDSVTTIGSYAFSGCTSLTSITLPFVGEKADGSGETHFGYIFGAYSYNSNDVNVPTSLKEVIITGGTTIGERAFYDCDSLTSIVIPDSVTTIGSSAFYDCDSLTSIIIPDSVTSIGENAFYDCDSLTSIIIPDSVTTIGWSAFSGCSSLTIYCEAPSEPSGWDIYCNYSDRPVYWGVNTDTLITGVEQNGIQYSIINGEAVVIKYVGTDTIVVIPSTIEVEGLTYDVTTIGYRAFSECSSLTSVTIGNSVTTIERNAFDGCSSLTSVTIGNSVTTIGEYAFSNCSSLTSVTIGNSVTTIGRYAFSNCDSLKSIVIPDSVTTIGSSAFDFCWSLTIYCEAMSKPSGWSSSWNSSNRPVYWAGEWSYVDGVPTLNK